ncbi:ubiquinone anaerobic biosynthesis accessory factor UbiT [Paremcibacter congregatus]|uniref:SCP2 domain-containing protein n=1 Tax=Paremcibacter congregatus TaxID=2043170 RepID=A0A2G4YQ67_9PROT|nr:SCP2 sterol-binding domain-containing protein [Paremcibacter congregatus]PHZ84463.1 hypothetical protein CRD36_11680 [Paremcibacter congregatus]QDE28681.1 hypothetical protein FIV45_16090 [Paremcibacter congregatus]
MTISDAMISPASISDGPGDSAPSSQNTPPPFSALMLTGLMLRPLPRRPLNIILDRFSARISRTHPAVFDRLVPLVGCHFVIRPTDLPHDLRLIIGDARVTCQLDDAMARPPEVVITGPFLSLIDMMDGRIDGDALFFARSLTVEGDTEALLTLRNAMDSDDIDLRAEILDALGPLHAPAKLFCGIGSRLFRAFDHDLTQIQNALNQPLSSRCDTLDQENQILRRRLNGLEQKLVKSQARLHSLSRKIAS